MVYQPRDPVGYKKLLTWKQAGDIYRRTKDFTRGYLDGRKDQRLRAHLDDSARSVQRNIEEGFKRTTTKEYVAFLGFSHASLEELKGDFEELKREWQEGIRWGERGKEGVGQEGIRWGEKGKEGAGQEGIRWADKGGEGIEKGWIGAKGIGQEKGRIRETVIKEIKELLDLIYGEDCMLGRQIASLERKMVAEKTLPQKEMIKRSWQSMRSADERFWRQAKEKFGIERDEHGLIRRVDKGKIREE